MINTQLQDQLMAALQTKKIEVKYPDGYKQWKEKFDYFFNITKDVKQTLDCLYGPNGGVDSYRGSIYVNSNLKVADVIASEPKLPNVSHSKKSKSFEFIQIKERTNNAKHTISGRTNPRISDNVVPSAIKKI